MTYQITVFTVRFGVQGIERFTLQLQMTDYAHKTFDMINLLHSCATGAFSHHLLSTACADACTKKDKKGDGKSKPTTVD